MIIRIVKMEFRPEALPDFKSIFEISNERIRNSEGCTYLQLLQSPDNPHIIFTYSHWESEDHLNRYRESEFFRNTWKKAKQLMAAKPQAWSLNRLAEVK